MYSNKDYNNDKTITLKLLICNITQGCLNEHGEADTIISGKRLFYCPIGVG